MPFMFIIMSFHDFPFILISYSYLGHVNPCGLTVVLCDIIIIYVLTMYLYYIIHCTLMLNKIHTHTYIHYLCVACVISFLCNCRLIHLMRWYLRRMPRHIVKLWLQVFWQHVMDWSVRRLLMMWLITVPLMSV